MVSPEILKKQLEFTLSKTDFPKLGNKYEGKVRDNYSKDGKRIIIVSDRLSAFDRIITEVPFKGQVLNQMAQFWFENTKNIIGNHIIEVPDPNVTVARECTSLPVEMVIRGYITGVTTTSAWYNYEKGVRNFCGNVLPEGLKKNQKFAKPIITPTTKAEHGGHDESISPEEVIKRGLVTDEEYDKMAAAAFKLYEFGVKTCAKQGIILVDTKYEFGKTSDGEIILIDEIHTPDSSRFWFQNEYEARLASGEEQKKIDKEYLREWLAAKGFRGEGEVPAIPDDVKVETARRYIEAYELITGQKFKAEAGDVHSRITKNLAKYL